VRPLLPSAVAALVLLGGCGGGAWYQRPLAGLRPPAPERAPAGSVERPVPCGSAPFPAVIEPGMRREVLRIGSIPFYGLGAPHGPGRFTPGAPPLSVVFTVPPRTRVVVAVPPALRGVAGVDGAPQPASTPARAHRALRCETGAQTTVYTASFVVRGARCLPLAVTIDRETITQRVPFGRRC
jgi:hypothetical protein